jgi:hypothetical protein
MLIRTLDLQDPLRDHSRIHRIGDLAPMIPRR